MARKKKKAPPARRPAQAQSERSTARSAAPRDEQEPVRRAPTPPPPIEFRYSANMPGYEEELMPPRTVHTAVDNGIAFPTGRQQGARPAGTRQKTAPPPDPRSTGKRSARQGKQGQVASAPRSQKPKRPARDSRGPAQREARKKKQVTKATMRRRKLWRRLSAVFFLLCVIGIGTFLTVTMLFKITAIEVRDGDGAISAQIGPYTSDQILTVLGVQLEENIFSFNAQNKVEQMEKQLPLLENIQVQRIYPGTVVVRAAPAVAVCTTPTSSGWLNLSVSLKILSVQSEQPALPVLYGGEPASTQPGDQLAYLAPAEATADAADSAAQQADSRMDVLYEVLDMLLEKELIAGVTRLEYEDPEQVAFLYEDRISVLLGTINQLDYKMEFARHLLLNVDGTGCTETDTGQIDCSHVSTDSLAHAILAQGEPVLPSGYQVPAQPEEAEEVSPDEAAAPQV